MLVLAFGFAADHVRAEMGWSLRPPAAEPVMYRGVLNLDPAGSPSGSLLYPAANGAGLIAAVIVHGLLVESHKDSQKKAMQEKADQVLEPFRNVLAHFKHPELMSKALAKTLWRGKKTLLDTPQAQAQGWLIESHPTFAMTQDQRALVLDNAISIFRPGNTTDPAYRGTIRIVSQPMLQADVQSFWNAQDGAALKEESVSLLSHSLELAVREAQTPSTADGPPFKTIRYQEGGAEKMERAQPLQLLCGRQIFRTLRGWLMSVPAAAPTGVLGDSCEQPLPSWK